MNQQNKAQNYSRVPGKLMPCFTFLTILTFLAAPQALRSEQLSSTEASKGAKDLFYKQKSDPTVVLNTGLQYWIELKRSGKTQSVSNKFAFRSGDSIRIHVIPNTDAYGYVILKEGSRGEQSVLFPDSRFHDDNKLKANKDYALPQDGFMTFDQNPGTEKLILLLSRKSLEANKYLKDKTHKHVIIASNKDGSKDLIPGSVVMAYSEADVSSGAPTIQAAADESKINVDKTNVDKNNSKTKPETKPFAEESLAQALTTFVQKDPAQVLSVELALAHQP